jgi:polyphosphate kinase 2 (PPK2 family)
MRISTDTSVWAETLHAQITIIFQSIDAPGTKGDMAHVTQQEDG